MARSRVRTSVVCVHQNQLLAFQATDPATGAEYVFLPGGAIEPHETAPEAAERETLEETGFAVHVDADSCLDAEYEFTWNGDLYNCLTLFYRETLTSPFQQAAINEPDYHKGIIWIPVAEISDRFSYSKEICDAVLALTK